ncbi:MAG: YhfC family intramembrane metalloprotease [Butyrivibrio sp.]|uniref:YhfC family intramembrane metalloprotease n=1 Tax=Butyrivibrio sp. TaxID=28121 RepID=UPI001B70BF16|nr:YhfC family glutamic-type intramembrane protease [Butyrivibrio sp.]MBP3784100.1 YhfC family intramembrane metalloprotease [Butyrivibrio sp.]
MKEFESIVMGKSSIPALSITIILMIAMTVCFFIYWRVKNKQQTNISYLIAGIVGFMVSARVLELGVHYFCIIMDNPVSRFITGSTIAYVIYGVTMAGVFEECGRHIVLKYIMKKNRTRENAVLYGIGHGGIEILGVILPSIITCLVVAIMFTITNGPLDVALASLNITEETAAMALPTVKAAAAFDYGMMAMNVIERLFAMVLHISLTVIVFYGVVSGEKRYLPLAIALHMLMDTFAALYQRGAVPLWSAEVWAAFWTVVSAFIAVRLYRKMAER